MKYVLTFLAVFVLVAGVALLWRFSGAEEPAPPGNQSVADARGDDPDEEPAEDNGSPETDESAEAGDFEVDVENTSDPVTGDKLGADHGAHAHYVYEGHLIHFAGAESVERFKRNPFQYLHRLELEPLAGGGVKQVDASDSSVPDLPNDCPFCGMPLDPDGDVYILHRNYKIFFG